ncbi:MAG: PQQ-binding-like beta-propeller repeat protein [Pirellulales bacterium]
MPAFLSRALLSMLALVLFGVPASAIDVWPEFRGPTGQGHAEAKNLPATWSETENVVWRTPLTGRGWSSPVADDRVVWLTTAVDQPLSDEQKKERLKTNTGDQPLNVAGHVDLFAVAVDRRSGVILHEIKIHSVDDPQWIHALNSYASPTPFLRDGKLYCHFGALGNVCFDTQTRKVLWTNDELRIMHENGPGSSPVVWKDKMIFHCDGSDVQYIAALDTATGKLAWKTPRTGAMRDNPQLKKAYGTPLIVSQEIDGEPRDVLLSPAADWLYAYDPATGASCGSSTTACSVSRSCRARWPATGWSISAPRI